MLVIYSKQAYWQGSWTTSYLCSFGQIYYSLLLRLTFKRSNEELISISAKIRVLRIILLENSFSMNFYWIEPMWMIRDQCLQWNQLLTLRLFPVNQEKRQFRMISSQHYYHFILKRKNPPLYYNDEDYFHRFQSCNGPN